MATAKNNSEKNPSVKEYCPELRIDGLLKIITRMKKEGDEKTHLLRIMKRLIHEILRSFLVISKTREALPEMVTSSYRGIIDYTFLRNMCLIDVGYTMNPEHITIYLLNVDTQLGEIFLLRFPEIAKLIDKSPKAIDKMQEIYEKLYKIAVKVTAGEKSITEIDFPEWWRSYDQVYNFFANDDNKTDN